MKVAFKDDSFAFEFVRNLDFSYYGGSDVGEMMATAGRITEGDFESWFTEWDKLARRILSRADASLGAGHLEAHAKHICAHQPTLGRPSSISMAIRETRAFSRSPGRRKKRTPKERSSPTLIFFGGFDSSLEELFYFGGAPAVRRGYNCLTFDGPGQGAPIREQKLPFRYDWEAVVTPAVDYALTRPDVDGANLALMGMSLGGYFAARAVTFEHRPRAAIFFDGLYDFHESLRGALPKEAIAALDAGDARQCEEIIYKLMQHNTTLRWFVTQGVWSFGVSSLTDFLTKSEQLTMNGIARQIQCPCLVLEAEGDMFIRGQPQKIYDALQAPKQLFPPH
jgi:pimeloyl-ACP methyl ester carboxylesterase